MHLTTVTSLTRRVGFLLLASAASAALGALGSGSANAAPGDNLPDNCLEFSANGTDWSTDADGTIPWVNVSPVPGKTYVQGAFKVKNTCDTAAKFQVWAGNWQVGGGGSAFLRADLGGSAGANKTLTGGPGILINEKKISNDTPMDVTLQLGIPAGETHQGYTIKPDWSFALEEVDPNDNGGGDNGGDDCDSGGSLGGLDLFGSLGGGCGDTGSLGASESAKLIHIDSPTVTVQ